MKDQATQNARDKALLNLCKMCIKVRTISNCFLLLAMEFHAEVLWCHNRVSYQGTKV